MKRFATFFVGLVIAVSAMAEASFDQIQTLIQQQQYSAAAAGLEGIIANHPKSAKAFYAMAQAQAGLGNLEKARKALDIATGLNPTLDFAPSSSVQSLRDAVTPQATKIVAVEESHFLRNFMFLSLFLVFGAVGFLWFKRYKEEETERLAKEAAAEAELEARTAEKVKRMQAEREAEEARERAARKAEEEAVARMKAHPNYGHERFDSANPDKLKSVKQFKEEQAELARQKAELEALKLQQAQARAEEAARQAQLRASYNLNQPQSAPTTTVVHTNSGNDMLTGIMIGNMLSGGHHHDTERTVIRETVREVEAPAKAPRSSWDDIDTPKTSSRDSSWDNDSSSRSSSRSSSWDSDSSSSSSSWSSSSSSDSSSSWSSSDSSSSSSWD